MYPLANPRNCWWSGAARWWISIPSGAESWRLTEHRVEASWSYLAVNRTLTAYWLRRQLLAAPTADSLPPGLATSWELVLNTTGRVSRAHRLVEWLGLTPTTMEPGSRPRQVCRRSW